MRKSRPRAGTKPSQHLQSRSDAGSHVVSYTRYIERYDMLVHLPGTHGVGKILIARGERSDTPGKCHIFFTPKWVY